MTQAGSLPVIIKNFLKKKKAYGLSLNETKVLIFSKDGNKMVLLSYQMLTVYLTMQRCDYDGSTIKKEREK